MKNSFLFFVLMSLIGCEPEGGICTDEFKMLSIEIVDSIGQAVELDSVKTVDTSGKIIYYGIEDQDPNSGYIVLTDSEKQKVRKKGSNFTFKGWLNGEEVVSEHFTIKNDGCHIALVECPDKIVIDIR